VTALGVLAICAVVAMLVVALSWKGLVLGALAFGILLLVADFERNSQLAADAFTCQALGSRDTVQSLIVLAGLTSVERYQLLYDSMGPDMAGKPLAEVPTREERRPIIESVLTRFGAVPHSPATLEMARTLYSRVPSAAERLNRLSGVSPGSSPITGAVRLAANVYARFLGLPSDQRTDLADLAESKPYMQAGALAAVISVLFLVLLVLRFPDAAYESFLAVVGLAGVALGIGSTHRAGRSGLKTGKLGWALVTCAVTFAAITMLGFCLTGQKEIARLALQFPITFALTLVLAAFGSAFMGRFGPPAVRKPRRPQFDGRGGTAHTLAISAEGKRRSAEDESPRPGAPAKPAAEAEAPAEPTPAEGTEPAARDGAAAPADGEAEQEGKG
jgi:hypothetical protein